MAEETTRKVIQERQHSTLKERREQIRVNILGWKGGRPYIDARLSRFAGEDDVDWSGGYRIGSTDQTIIAGRRQQAHVLPYLGRIVDKINQYIFAKPATREGIDADFEKDADRQGNAVAELMKRANSYLTTARWCWLKVDAPRQENGREYTRADKARLKVRPYWQVVSPLKVVDWKIDDAGRTSWVLYEDIAEIADDPFTPAVRYKYRQLWRPGKVTTYRYGNQGESNADKIVSQETINLSLTDVVPWVLVGEVSCDPHWFDSCEGVGRTILDLESCNRQNFFNTVFAQPYIPASVLETTMQKFRCDAHAAVAMIFGYNYPILLSEGDQAPGYMMPDADATGKMGEELGRLRKELYDSIGLMVMQETKQVASAEAKAFDHNEVAAVMGERAGVLEQAEAKGAEITNQYDPSLPVWRPEYSREFKVDDSGAHVEPLVKALNVSMPPELHRFGLERLYGAIRGLGTGKLDPEREAAILAAIEDFDPGAGMVDVLSGARPGEGDGTQAGAGKAAALTALEALQARATKEGDDDSAGRYAKMIADLEGAA